MTSSRLTNVNAPATLTRLSASERYRIFFYLGILITLLAFGAPFGGLIDIPISFLLKNKLHLTASEVTGFRLLAAIPLFLSFLFGFLRDIWNPFGMKDRGFLMVFGAIGAGLYVVFAFAPMTYATLLAAVVLVTIAFLFVTSAQNGLASEIGQQHVMSGQISAAWNIFASLPAVVALLAGGWLSEILESTRAAWVLRILFLSGAAIMAAIAIFGVWKPRDVFDNLAPASKNPPLLRQHIRILAGHWPIYPALLIWLLWNFAPGSATPLQYYLQNTLHATDTQWGQWNAIFAAAFIPTFAIFGYLCRKIPLRTLLFWGTAIAVPQMLPLLFIHSLVGALIVAVPIGLMGGIATAAYLDLLIRAGPAGLQGTTLMLSGALYFIAARFGDVLGAWLYDQYGGFVICVIATTMVYALILPIIFLIPQHLIATHDGEILHDKEIEARPEV
jgi:MFS family permease